MSSIQNRTIFLNLWLVESVVMEGKDIGSQWDISVSTFIFSPFSVLPKTQYLKEHSPQMASYFT